MAEVRIVLPDRNNGQLSDLKDLCGLTDVEPRAVATELNYVDVISEHNGEVLIPIDANGNRMTPIEASTGMPLPIISTSSNRPSNKHHEFHHAPVYENGCLGFRAMRFARLERVQCTKHKAFHELYPGGTATTTDEAEQAKLIILSLAKYFPKYGINTSKDRIEVLTTGQRLRLSRPEVFLIERPSGLGEKPEDVIGEFLMNHVINQNLDHVQELIEEFLSLTEVKISQDQEALIRKHRLAKRLTNIAIEVAVGPLINTYEEAKRSDLFGARRGPSPTSVWEEVKRFICGQEIAYMGILEARLAGQYAEPALA